MKDKSAAVAAINEGDKRFRDRDIYPFCFETTGNYVVVAHGRPDNVLGLRADQVVDKNGRIIAGQMQPFAIEGQIKTAVYWWPQPGGTETAEKEAYYSLVEDLVCGVGYNK